jgi:hypothetical protein
MNGTTDYIEVLVAAGLGFNGNVLAATAATLFEQSCTVQQVAN